MEETCTIIPLHVLKDMPKEVIFELLESKTGNIGRAENFCGGRCFL